MADLPANVGYGIVTGRIVTVVADTTGDANVLPDMLPCSGQVFFTPNLASGFAKNINASLLISAQPVTCVLDSEGYLIDAQGNRSVTLVATNDTDLQPLNFTYTVSFNLTSPGGVVVKMSSFSMALLEGTTIDLAAIAPTTASVGTSLSVAEAAAAAAATSAAIASAGGSGGMTTEQIQDMLSTFFIAGTGIQLTYNDIANTFTIVNTGVTTVFDGETARDTIGAALVAGTGISISVNDTADTITVTNTGPTVTQINQINTDIATANTRITGVEDSTKWIWHTRTGGVLTNPIDIAGDYPPHPITTRQLEFSNPSKQPLGNGSRVTGGGGMDLTYPSDYWVGPA